ncbi:MAG: DUF3306 domain-containing protein [Pseudomonadota bacterium]
MTTELDFWSRRKARVEAEAEAHRKVAAEVQAAEAQAALEEKTDEEICAELELPNPETLQAGDDASPFMKAAVPERLRRRALRTLWRSNPVFANVDGLVDYGDDFTNANCVIENMQTAYQVGKGMLAHVEKLAKEAEALAEAQDDESASEVELTEPSGPVLTAVRAPEPKPAPTPIHTSAPEEEQPVEATPAPRRMQFSFPTPQESTPA